MDDGESCQSDYNIQNTLVKKVNTIKCGLNYFGLKADPEACPVVKKCSSPVCKVCAKVVPVKGWNTSNLLTHLRDHR